jgi:peptidoglycan/LPS O-acetylase OafA/YrhL
VTRRPQLDALRGLAVALVVLHHWTAWGLAIGLGNVGVQLFFVLSGFLITGILLAARGRMETGDTDLKRVLATFFEHRAARIWPVFFATIALVYLAGDRFERQVDMLWHALFGSNVLFFLRGGFDSALSHFWSLAVEQQFYLIWPFVILLVPRLRLEPVVVAFIVLAPLTRLTLATRGYPQFAQYNVLPLANLDSLGLGALAALWMRRPDAEVAARWRILKGAALAAMAGLPAAALLSLPGNMEQTLYAVLFAAVVAGAFRGIGGAPGRLLANRALIALGTISYGVYVYHVFAPRAVGAALRAVDAPPPLHSAVSVLTLSTALTIAVAALSWRLMERPVLALGHRSSRLAHAPHALQLNSRSQ